MTEAISGGKTFEGLSMEDMLHGLPAFEPIAYYDKHLDAIRVQIIDCSISEERLDHIMSVYHANHHHAPDGFNDVVGFAIKGVRHLLVELGIEEKGEPFKIAELLDGLVKKYPSRSTKFVLDFYSSLRHPKPEEVELDFRECA